MENDEYLLILGSEIRRRRESLGFTQEGFADTYQFSNRFYGDIERGIKNISIKTLRRIAKGLNTSSSELLRVAEISMANVKD